MENKQTAINWLMDNIDIDFNPETNTISMRRDIWEKALEMEKEQIIKAWKYGDGEFDTTAEKYAERYYNETFNK